MDTITYKKLHNLNPVDYWPMLWTSALRSGPVCDKYRPKGTILDGLRSSIWQKRISYWSKNKEAALQEISRPLPSLTSRQTISSSTKWKNQNATTSSLGKRMWCLIHLKLKEAFCRIVELPSTSNLLAPCETLIVTTRLSTALISTTFMFSGHSWQCRLNRKHSQLWRALSSRMQRNLSGEGILSFPKTVWSKK